MLFWAAHKPSGGLMGVVGGNASSRAGDGAHKSEARSKIPNQ